MPARVTASGSPTAWVDSSFRIDGALMVTAMQTLAAAKRAELKRPQETLVVGGHPGEALSVEKVVQNNGCRSTSITSPLSWGRRENELRKNIKAGES
ncbi:hypothetical protein Y032_0990g3307 [Ancylostoma ceylanicum]|uniref:Uncharacterized protein n=1 Tax=Ancylostoma ceylanicum TaxID=53326 RepID=A0A016W7C4_9BILA|nr:hypothetical protein Y032_0990g3307 [Ancylostoma ceylanicum]